MKRVGKGFSGKETPLFPTMMVQNQAEMGEGSAIPTDPHHTPTIIQPSTSQPQKKQRSRRPKRKDTEVPQPSGPTTNVVDEAVYKEMDDSLEKAATTATVLDAEQDRVNIDKDPVWDYKCQASPRMYSKFSNDPCSQRDLAGEEVFVAKQGVSDKDVNLSVDEVTLAQALAALKSVKLQEKSNVIEEPSESITTTPTLTTTTTATTIIVASTRPKAKGLVIHEDEQATTPTKKELIRLDEEIASKLQAEFDEEVRLAREKAEKEQEANVALTEEWDDIQAKIEADHELAQRLQAQEQEELSDAEKATLFVQLLEKRRKHFAAKRAEEKRNKPPTQAQQRKIMCTYLKNMEGKKPKDLKNKSFDSIQKMFDRAFKRVNTFVDFRTDLVEGSSKRAGEELEQENAKKQKVDDDKETAELKSLMEVMPDEEEVALDAIPLAVKSPSIVDWKIHKEGKKSYYQIIRADGSSKMYLVFSHMLKSFDREDLETLYKLVKAKYGSTRPVEDLDLVLYGDLKTMFEPHVEDNVWKNQSDYRVLDWKLYDSCGVHLLRKQNVHIHMLVEKRYPLTAPTITDMLNKKLQCDHLSEMAYQLLKLLTKQLKNQ
ncbi:hypothetical protein Tco_0549229 [Tanacetum coccineum]